MNSEQNDGCLKLRISAPNARRADETGKGKQRLSSGHLDSSVRKRFERKAAVRKPIRERGASLAAADLHNARISSDFVDDVSKTLQPKRVAIVAEVEEDWITPVDTRMEIIGGTVFRRSLSDVEDTVDDEEIAAIKADLAQMKAEHAQARADRKAKLQEKIDQLSSKLHALFQKAKEQRQAAERDAQLKLDALKAKAKALAAKAGAK